MFCLNGDFSIGTEIPVRNFYVLMAFPQFLRQERNEGRIEIWSVGALQQFLRCTRRQNLSIIHRDQPVETLGLFHISGRDNDAHSGAILADIINQLPELAPG
ncbi:hypothetical protein HED54_07265 [Ochrobactrum anthropi ATCC 49188]|nr:hypothetical protein [Brucella anthropi ATCC 49188]